jgi:hypothetical protein
MPAEPGASDDKATGARWSSLTATITGIATLLTAIAGLVVALQQIGLLSFLEPRSKEPVNNLASSPKPAAGSTLDATTAHQSGSDTTAVLQVDGLRVTNIDAREASDGSYIELAYRITAGPGYARHDPARFVRLVVGDHAVTPEWESAPATDLSGQADFAVRFKTPTDLRQSVVIRFGEGHPRDITVPLPKEP